MKKTYILIILFTVIILGIMAGIYIFISNENKRTDRKKEKKNNKNIKWKKIIQKN